MYEPQTPHDQGQIKEKHKEAIDVHVVCYLETRVRVMNAGPFKECPKADDRRSFMIHV